MEEYGHSPRLLPEATKEMNRVGNECVFRFTVKKGRTNTKVMKQPLEMNVLLG